MESFSESRIPVVPDPHLLEDVHRLLRMGPRQTLSGFKSSQAKERTHTSTGSTRGADRGG